MRKEFIDNICICNERLISNSIIEHARYTSIKIDVSDFLHKRTIDSAEIRIPHDFLTNGRATIYVDKKYCLRIPHVESDGKVCVGTSDSGSLSGDSPEDRIGWLIRNFEQSFILPWNDAQLDYDFIKEPISYWSIFVKKRRSRHSAVRFVYVDIDNIDNGSSIEGKLLCESRTIVASNSGPKKLNELINSIKPSDTLLNIEVLVVNIDQPYAPSNWPSNDRGVIDEIRYYKGNEFIKNFVHARKLYKRKKHHLIIFNHKDIQYGYLLSNGPRTVEKNTTIYSRKVTKERIQTAVLPLEVNRIDQSWIVGRDAISAVTNRSKLNVLTIGCGALGSFIINHLAQSGVGNITIVDDDMFEAENISRHSLGMNSINKGKVNELKRELANKFPHCAVNAVTDTFVSYSRQYDINQFDLIVDASGEDLVALEIETLRNNVPLIKAWMEPYVTAAHVCYFPPDIKYKIGFIGRVKCASWPSNVMTKLPGCSSYFQSYTVTGAAFAVAMASELIMETLDSRKDRAIMRTWLREESYFTKFHPEVVLSEWTIQNALQYGQVKERDINE